MEEKLITRIRTEVGDLQIDYNALANKLEFDSTLTRSGFIADAKAVGEALDLKASIEYVNSLDVANATDVDAKLALKASIEYVDSLNAANATDVEEQLALKASIEYVDSLNAADTEYVNEQLSLKADKEYVEAMLTVPSSTEDDDGKFLRVVGGIAAWQKVPNAEESGF